jgi:hypothetical protein
MLLAHLIGDYVLQWDRLASWKSRELKGVLVHGAVVFAVTWLFALPFDPTWWQGVVFISLTHILVDGLQLRVKLPVAPLIRFILDQMVHITVIFVALVSGGYVELSSMAADLLQSMRDDHLLAYLLGYAFITMPAWVVVKFAAYGLVKGSAPNFPEGANKYIGILERILITTFVVLGQFLLVPMVAVPRLVLEWPKVAASDRAPIYVVELLASITLAIAIGLGLRRL